jgi:anti-sigma factor (TIGR02949 family)
MTSEATSEECSRVVDLLVDYLEGTLPPDTEHDLDAHLAACTRCISQLRTYRTTVSLLRGLCDDDLPVELRETVAGFLSDRITH